jgi:hypothetical protein
MKKLFVVLAMVCFVFSVSGLSFAQTSSTTALQKAEKAIESSTSKETDTTPTAKPGADTLKTEGEKTAVEKGAHDKVSTEKTAAEKSALEKAAEEKAKSALPKM